MSDETAEPTTTTHEPPVAAADEHAHAVSSAEAEVAPAGVPELAPLPAAAADGESPFAVSALSSDATEEGPKKTKKPRAKKEADPSADAPEADAPPSLPEISATDDSEAAPLAGSGDEQAEVAAGDVSAEPPPPENKKKWYAIKVQSGREDTIKAAILRKVAIEHLEDVFGQIMIPVEKVIEKKAVRVKDKKTGEYTTQEKKVERKIKKFQGYIFAEIEFNDRMLYLIRETSGVGDFLKLRPRVNDTPVPEPMSDAEVKQMLGEKVGPEAGKVVKLDIEKGDRVRIKEGSFKDSEGEVKDIQMPKDPTDPPKIVVEVTFWGRPLPVELEYWQVTKV